MLQLQLRETVTSNLVHELVTGDLDLILVALPIEDPEVETLYLFDDRFILATKATKANQRLRHANADMLSHDRLLLLEEGHCLRDQALSYCHMLTPEARDSFGASSLATIVQMVANGYGITLLPEMAIASEVHASGRIRLLRFDAPEPKREIGLAWRKTSPRKNDFIQFAAVVARGRPAPGKTGAQDTRSALAQAEKHKKGSIASASGPCASPDSASGDHRLTWQRRSGHSNDCQSLASISSTPRTPTVLMSLYPYDGILIATKAGLR